MRSGIFAGIIVFAVFAAGCSGADPMPLAEYADEITEVTGAYVLETQEISFRYQTAVERQVEALTSSGTTAGIDGAMTIVRSETAN